MDRKNSQGQILTEVALVMVLVVVVLFGAMTQIASAKKQHHKYQFTQEGKSEKASRFR